MKNISFKKKCNVKKLHEELETANFNIYGVSCDQTDTIVHLKDAETKDPTNIVNSHVYSAPITKKSIDMEKLVAALISKSIIANRAAIEV